MTRQEMQNKLDRKDISGVGVKVTFDFSSGETGTTYYFYEDFEDDFDDDFDDYFEDEDNEEN